MNLKSVFIFKLQPIANGVIGNMESVRRHAEEEREQIIERFWFTSQMEEKLVLAQHGKLMFATPNHVQKQACNLSS